MLRLNRAALEFMRMYSRAVAVLVLFASLAVAQTKPVQTRPAPPSGVPTGVPSGLPTDVPTDPLQHQRHDDDDELPPASAASVPPDSPVITIEGICDRSSETAASGRTSAPATTPECKTIVTKAQFEKLVEALNPQMAGPARRQLAESYPRLLVFADKARELGLDQDPHFADAMRFVSMQILTQHLTLYFEEQAAKISDSDIDAYYKTNAIRFEREEMLRIFVPKQKRQEKTVSGERSSSTADSPMLAVAEKIRSRAAAGEDFLQLQKEAFEAANIASGSPSVGTGKIAAIGLPIDHRGVFEMEPGQVSAIIADSSGYYIYKVVSKEKVPLAQASREIRKSIVSDRVQDATASLGKSIKSEFDQKYFGATRARHSDQSAAKPGNGPPPK
jgi:hypothetical protein